MTQETIIRLSHDEIDLRCQYCKIPIDIRSGTYTIVMQNHSGSIWCSFGCFRARMEAGHVEERINTEPTGEEQ